jgi:ubiquitin-conjugating enzyme E2 Q
MSKRKHATDADIDAEAQGVRYMHKQHTIMQTTKFIVSVDDHDAFSWMVGIPSEVFKRRSAEGAAFCAELRAYHARHPDHPDMLKLHVAFPTDAPRSNPFVRVISPRFRFHTGHVTTGGSICAELLTAQGWQGGTTVQGLLDFIVSLIIDGQPQLDMHDATPYGIAEARAAYTRMLDVHGWK